MSELLIILCICAGLLYWQAAARAKEMAVSAARRECKTFNVQLLDSTVQLIRFSMSRDQNDRWRIWREYRFAYATDGEQRFEGRLTLLGPRVIRIALETFNPVIH
jgi:hypothetical protein